MPMSLRRDCTQSPAEGDQGMPANDPPGIELIPDCDFEEEDDQQPEVFVQYEYGCGYRLFHDEARSRCRVTGKHYHKCGRSPTHGGECFCICGAKASKPTGDCGIGG